MATFQNDIWNIETRTRLRGRNIDFYIFEKKNLVPRVEQLLSQGIITLPDLIQALTSGDLELHGNYIWVQGSTIYSPRIKDEQQKLQHIHDALYILNNATLRPLEKVQAIDTIPGFGENNATGLVMLFHPDEFALINPVSKGTLKKLGVNLTARTPLESIQYELRSLKEALNAQDFLELDWFLYQCSQGIYTITDLEPGTGGGLKRTWLDYIKQVLEEAGEPLHISEITIRVLARGIQTRGSTPERTVSYMLTTHPRIFEKVSDGVYRLREDIPPKETINMPEVEVQEYTEPLLKNISQTILGQGMSIDEQTLRRYHLALKTRGFVILSGVSGTGKTWLTEAYANAVGAKYLLEPVAPNWTTNEDLLGYVDPLNDGLYHHTSVSYFLEEAAQEYEQSLSERRRPKPYHLVLDEMNLARVEYYFAKFLSAMEVRTRSGIATIELGAQKVINLYPNLFFIGTINVDETTHDFADKIYDRAQLIELTASRDALKMYIGEEPFSDLLMAVWDVVHEIAPFAFRVLDEIKVYITATRNLGLEWEEALDEQILQKILPKCKGTNLRIGDSLKKLESILPADTYPLSHAKLQRMIEGFKQYGVSSPPTSRIGFLDQAANSIDGPVEWILALVEVYVDPQDWDRVRLIRQIDEELPLSLRRLGGKVRVIATWPPSATGHFRLTLHFDDEKLEEQIITIQSRKITTAAYTRLLEDLEMRLPATIALGLQRNGALAGIKIHPPGESTRVMELARLRRAINGDSEHMGLAQVLNNLATDPHKILHTTELWVPRERARRPHPSGLIQAMSRPYNLDKHGIPVRLLDTRVEHSVDVYENRLVKAYVRLVDLHLSRLSHILESRSTKTMLEEVLKLRDILSIARRNATFLDDVTLPSYLPTQSTMVLIKRPAYLAALEGYLEFHKSPEVYLEEPLLEAPLENLPFLYQIWGTLEVLYVLLDITGTLGYEVKLQQLTKKEVDGIFIQLLPNGKPMLILEHPNTGTVIRMIPECAYTSQGQFRSISFTQRPDIAIEILPPQGPPNIYLFDPKYKLESERQEEGQGNGKTKKEDIDKMHTYRDAIRGGKGSIVVQYAAIMYPGTYQSYEAGIEALQAYPGLEGLLEDRLKEIFSAALRA